MTDRKILLTTGCETDQNGTLVGMIIPSTVTKLSPPARVVFNGITINALPTDRTALQEFNAPNVTTITAPIFDSCSNLQTVNFSNLESITSSTYGAAPFGNCPRLSDIRMSNLKYITITSTTSSGVFRSDYALVNVTLDSIIKISSLQPGYGSSGAFYQCSGLQNIQLGSTGHPVTELSSITFNNCTQSGLTITVYTADGSALSGAPWGATNATIVYEEA